MQATRECARVRVTEGDSGPSHLQLGSRCNPATTTEERSHALAMAAGSVCPVGGACWSQGIWPFHRQGLGTIHAGQGVRGLHPASWGGLWRVCVCACVCVSVCVCAAHVDNMYVHI